MITVYPSDDGTSTTRASNAHVSTDDASGVALEDETLRRNDETSSTLSVSDEEVIDSAPNEQWGHDDPTLPPGVVHMVNAKILFGDDDELIETPRARRVGDVTPSG